MPENPEIGASAPEFKLRGSDGKEISLHQFQGKWVVLYFYPKDNTPGCTKESCDFRDNKQKFVRKEAVILGVSKDSLPSHDKFIRKFNLNFLLLSDTEGKVCEQYGVFKKKSMFGKTFLGINRSTFLIDPQGKIAEIWRNVKVDGHAEEVLHSIK